MSSGPSLGDREAQLELEGEGSFVNYYRPVEATPWSLPFDVAVPAMVTKPASRWRVEVETRFRVHGTLKTKLTFPFSVTAGWFIISTGQ